MSLAFFFFFNDTATTEIYTLSLHDALPISARRSVRWGRWSALQHAKRTPARTAAAAQKILKKIQAWLSIRRQGRSEEHTSELQSRQYLVCRLLLEKKKKNTSVNE